MTNEEIKTEATEVVHKRRKRYSGTHPRKFSEKYKYKIYTTARACARKRPE